MNLIRDKYYYECDSLLLGIQKTVIEELESHAKILTLKKNKILFKEDAYPDGLYRLIKGKVKIYQYNSDGKFQILYLYSKDEFFGFRPILSGTKNPVAAETIEDCQLLFYPKEHFLNALNKSPVLMKNLLKALSYEFNVWVNLMSTFSHKAVKARVAFALLILNEKFKKNDSDKIAVINFGRADLASFAGTTTETCVRVLTQFKEKKIISSEGRKIKILKEQELINIASIS
ncbi:Crp/Fnr family transcriptional regulator [soil metagenome]